MPAPRVQVYDANDNIIGSAVSGDANTGNQSGTAPLLFNGATYDRQRSTEDRALINATAVTTGQSSGDQVNYNARGVKVVLQTTAIGTGSVTVTIQGKDAASGQYYTLLAGAAVTTNTTNVYSLYPGLTAAANTTANDVLPHTWRVTVTANNANAATYTVGASLIL